MTSSPAAPFRAADLNREADHRIANSLAMIASLIRLTAAAGGDLIPKSFFVEIADRIETVARLHRHLAHSGDANVELSAYLRGIFDQLSQSLAAGTPAWSVDCPPGRTVPPNVAMALGLIIAELFSNSLKYAHPAGLDVSAGLSCDLIDSDKMRLVYEDDGVGFPEGFDRANESHLGMRFIRLLSEQLKGTQKWHSDALGVHYEIVIPI